MTSSPADLPAGYRLRRARFAELDARTFHDLARLRERVFIVEQECAYLELDGRDVEAETVHFWIEADPDVAAGSGGQGPREQLPVIAATLRLLKGRRDHGSAASPSGAEGASDAAQQSSDHGYPADGGPSSSDGDPEPRVIGRVVTAPEHRGHGLAAVLLSAAVAECDASADAETRIELHAQSHLTGWYGRFGFAPCGPEFLEDGIPHTPMRRPTGLPT
ncbi:GNAT family N-acetyltransferase [Leucobacter sp. GX24907]